MRTAVLLLLAFAAGVLSRPAYRLLRPAPAPAPLAEPVAREPHRHAAFLRQVRLGPSHYPTVLLGDSIAECWSLVPDLQTAAFGPGTLNLGVGSDGVEHALWRVRHGELSGYAAPRVVVCIGTNNLYAGRSPGEVAAAVAVLVDDIHRLQPAAEVVLLAVPPRGERPGDPLRLRVAELNRLLAAVPGTRFVDAGGSLLEPDGTISRLVMPDFLHPSPEGYRRWAGEIARLTSPAAP